MRPKRTIHDSSSSSEEAATNGDVAHRGNSLNKGIKKEPEDPVPFSQKKKKAKIVNNGIESPASVKVTGAKVVKRKVKIKEEVKEEEDVDQVEIKGEVLKEEEEEEYKWWLEQNKDDSIKWTSLVHNGVLFPPEYVPHGIKMKYDGVEVDLPPEAEEVASFFGQLIGTAYVENPTFCANFFEDFKQLLKDTAPEEAGKIQEFDKCDFSPINEYFEKLKEEKKLRSKEDKNAEKLLKTAIEEKYGWALLDGRKEKVGNFRVEPPGLFRGRGDHPKTGRLKKRVLPEQITLNISKDAPIPVPPEGHKWGGIVHDNKVTWLATWKENVNGNVKYVFLAADSSLRGQSDFKKFEKARELKKHIKNIRSTYMEELKDHLMMVRQRATALYLIDIFALRAGNEKGDDEADTVGCCSLRYEHIELEPPNKVTFDFLGKDSIRYYNEVLVDPQVWRNLKLFKKEPKQDGDPLFDRLTTTGLNKHLQSLMPGLTAKVFRTYNASITMQEELQKLTPPNGSEVEKMLAYNRANRQVAVLCNHQRTIPKSHGTAMEKLSNRIRALKFDRRNTRLHQLACFANLDSEKPSLEESDLEEEWCHEYERIVIEEGREKARKKHQKAQEKEDKDEAKIQAQLDKELNELDQLEKLYAQRREDPKVVVPVMKEPTTLDKFHKRLEMINQRIERLKSNVTDKEENKATALGTSKINYIDPRITVAWCEKFGMKKAKMFNNTLMKKFQWAMDVDSNWIF